MALSGNTHKPARMGDKKMEQKINTKYKIVETNFLGVPLVQLKKKVIFFWMNVKGADTIERINDALQKKGVIDPVIMERKIFCG